ncbi:DUF2382 domain-containing protein [Streptomyces lavendulae]|uniref:DUF2382 domain-containing protein n=1 Tax=Streptomyces lavendulae TaxID=1914 RepID=UPI0033F26BE6
MQTERNAKVGPGEKGGPGDAQRAPVGEEHLKGIPQDSNGQVEVTLHRQHLVVGDTSLRRNGTAQVKTKVITETESVSVPVVQEHVKVVHESIDPSQLVPGATIRMTDGVLNIPLHGGTADVTRQTEPYERARYEVKSEVHNVTVEADCGHEVCEVSENITDADGDVRHSIRDSAYSVMTRSGAGEGSDMKSKESTSVNNPKPDRSGG